MGPRPAHLKLNSEDSSSSQPVHPPRPFFQHGDLPSPRTGEAPPALSPLDAFAMHSRMLQKRFEDSEQKGRRISRLQHADVAKELANRPGYFRNLSSESAMSDVPEVREDSSPTSPQHQAGVTVAGDDEKNRPVSHYPMLGNIGRPERPGTALSTAFEENLGPETPDTATPFYDAEEGPGKQRKEPDYFGVSAPRASSPEPVDPRMISVQAASPLGIPSLSSSMDSVQSTQPRTLTNGSTRSQRSLAPPRSPAYPKSPRSMHSIRSVPPDSGDDDASVNGAYPVSSSRKFSGSSNLSRPTSPFSPYVHPMHRSPSMTSEYSINGSQRRTNFSRPLSSGSNRAALVQRPSFDSRSSFETGHSVEALPHRQASAASGSVHLSSGTPSRQPSGDEVATPFATPLTGNTPLQAEGGADYFGGEKTDNAASYTYASYALPRGRTVERNSRGTRDSWIQKQFTWDDAKPAEIALSIPEESSPRPATRDVASPGLAPASPFPLTQRSMSATTTPMAAASPLEERSASVFEKPFAQEERHSSAASSRKGRKLHKEQPFEKPFAQEDRPRSASSSKKSRKDRTESPFRKPFAQPVRPPSAGSQRSGRGQASSSNSSQSAGNSTFQKSEALHKSTAPSVKTHNTDSTDKTIRAKTLHERVASADLTPDEHLDIGISAHSAGELTKSTYHLRLAAHAGLPTAMLLYALACRHGWGMRPNQTDGVMWLRKAIDGSGIEVADVEGTLASTTSSSDDPVADAQERKKRKAQFALAIYELGISYMNGWGCPKDKPLAVRCYEGAGSWGDCDALAEAGFCYTQGSGVKKDLKKAAGLYRRAAEGGMSMAGNSWYVVLLRKNTVGECLTDLT